MPVTAPYGSWKSPITAASLAADVVRLIELNVDGDDVFWVEMRPKEGARYVLVRHGAEGGPVVVIPAPYAARTLVHEYGGGAFAACGPQLLFSNFADQRLYALEDGVPRPLTPEGPRRFADAAIDEERGRAIVVCEDHSASSRDARTTLVEVPLPGGEPRTIHEGYDFYANPRLSPDGARLLWLCWNHPQMPWDGTELWLADVAEDGSLLDPRRVAGGPRESIFQPSWSPDGTLYCVSDRGGWWNLHRLEGDGLESVLSMEAEFGRPLWVFGETTYGFLDDGRIAATFAEAGIWRLGLIDPDTGELARLDTPFTAFGYVHTNGDQIVCIASSPTVASAVVRIDPASGSIERLRSSASEQLDPVTISEPEAIEFPTKDGWTAHAFYYRPRNPDYAGPPDERPPLIVMSHGGPTSQTTAALRATVQYWTSRGLAVVDVNYGGSSGYGNAYRRRLNGAWGIVDVDDCEAAARYLADRGDVDGKRLAITGGSAGGYTTLCALTFRDLFSAGASHYGVSDAAALATDTHKFESRYLDTLIGPYPERAEIYEQRSPIHAVERLTTPVIFMQGLDDKIVPPDQAQRMVDALKAKGVPVAYLPFEGEQHGFRRAANQRRALEAELDFYGRIFGFSPADEIEPVEIHNL